MFCGVVTYSDPEIYDHPPSTIDMWYLHAPDRTVPYEITMQVVNELYQEGRFKRFGISNFSAYVWPCFNMRVS
jgi:aflatoxin B1 aldehyde reductase